MTVQDDLAALFDIPELTVPVQLGDAVARGYFDQAGTTLPVGSAELQLTGPVLFLAKDALAGLVENAEVRVGAVGEASAASGRRYLVHQLTPVQDGLVLACQLGGGR